MKRKMMTRENIPSKKTTNGGNGAYMRRAIMQDKKRGKHGKSSGMTGPVTATGRPTVKSL